MKKLFSALLCFAAVFALASCGPTDDSATTAAATTTTAAATTEFSMEFENAKATETVAFGKSYDVMSGIILIGSDDIAYGDKVTAAAVPATGSAATCTITSGKLDTQSAGACVITYSATVNGVTATTTRTVTIEEEVEVTNILTKPFIAKIDAAGAVAEGNLDGWGLYDAGSGAETYSVVDIDGNSYFRIEQTTVAGSSYEQRLSSGSGSVNQISLIPGKEYKVTFQAMATVAKTVNVQVGEMIGSAPYFYSACYDGVTAAADGTYGYTFPGDSTMHDYTFTFTAKCKSDYEDAINWDKIGILFEFGTVGAVHFEDATTTAVNDPSTITVGNVGIGKVSADGPEVDTIAPKIAVKANNFFEIDAESEDNVDLATLVKVTDNETAGATLLANTTFVITDSEEQEVENIPLNVAGVYTVAMAVEDEAGNEKTASFVVTVSNRTAPVEGENLYANVADMSATNNTGVLGDAWKDAEKDGAWGVWFVADVSWNCGALAGVSAATVDADNDNQFTITTTATGDNIWSIQAKYFEKLEFANDYKVTVTVTSTVARANTPVVLSTTAGAFTEAATQTLEKALEANTAMVYKFDSEFIDDDQQLQVQVQLGQGEAGTCVVDVDIELDDHAFEAYGFDTVKAAAEAELTKLDNNVIASWAADWDGASTEVVLNADSIVITSNKGGSGAFWANQVFAIAYKAPYGTYDYNMTLKSDVDMFITINGQVFELEANVEKNIELDVVIAADLKTILSIQFGKAAVSEGTTVVSPEVNYSGTLTITNDTFVIQD